MNRQLFIEVFRRVSSKIDELKTFFVHDKYHKVNTEKKDRLFIYFFKRNSYSCIHFLGGECSFNRSF